MLTELRGGPADGYVNGTGVPAGVVYGYTNVPGSSVPHLVHEAGEAFDVAYSQAAVVQCELAIEHGGERRFGTHGVAKVLEHAHANETRLCPQANRDVGVTARCVGITQLQGDGHPIRRAEVQHRVIHVHLNTRDLHATPPLTRGTANQTLAGQPNSSAWRAAGGRLPQEPPG